MVNTRVSKSRTWMDLFSRKIVGWAVAASMTAELVIDALKNAILREELPAGLIVHSDRGGQYVDAELRKLIEQHGFEQSMSRAEETYDNAFAESLFSRYKAELLEGGAFADSLRCDERSRASQAARLAAQDGAALDLRLAAAE